MKTKLSIAIGFTIGALAAGIIVYIWERSLDLAGHGIHIPTSIEIGQGIKTEEDPVGSWKPQVSYFNRPEVLYVTRIY